MYSSTMHMLIGTGKTAVMREVLRGLNSDVFTSVSLNMNSFSDASAVQLALEQPLEKKSGAKLASCLTCHTLTIGLKFS